MSQELQLIRFDPKQASRIGIRMARGLTMEQACVLEMPLVDWKDFEQQLKVDVQVQIAFKRAQARYIEVLVEDIEGGDKCGGSQWILTKAHKAQYGDGPSTVTNNLTINGFSPEIMAQIRKRASERAIVEVKDAGH